MWRQAHAVDQLRRRCPDRGTLALFNIERDLKQGGHGFGRADPAGDGLPRRRGQAPPPRSRCAPVTSPPGAGGGPDQINVLYGNSSFYVASGHASGSDRDVEEAARRGGFKHGRSRDSSRSTRGLGRVRQLPADRDHQGQRHRQPDGRATASTPLHQLLRGFRPPSRRGSTGATGGALHRGNDLQPRPRAAAATAGASTATGALTRSDAIISGRGSMQIAEGVDQPQGRIRHRHRRQRPDRSTEWSARAAGRLEPGAGGPRRVAGSQQAVRDEHRSEHERRPGRDADGGQNPCYFGDRIAHRS